MMHRWSVWSVCVLFTGKTVAIPYRPRCFNQLVHGAVALELITKNRRVMHESVRVTSVQVPKLPDTRGLRECGSSGRWQRLGDLLWWNDFGYLGDGERLHQCLSWRAAFEAVALIGALEIVVAHEAIQITLDLLWADVPGLPSLHSEALIEQRAVHALDEAVGPRAAYLGGAMLDLLHDWSGSHLNRT